jgi:hypothetical protein
MVRSSSSLADQAAAPETTGYTQTDFVDPRIDAQAQGALYRLYQSRGQAATALRLLGAVRAGVLTGIAQEDQSGPARLAASLGKSWWTLITPGKNAEIVPPTYPPASTPQLAYRARVASDADKLAAALGAAWTESSFSALPVPFPPPGSGVSGAGHTLTLVVLDDWGQPAAVGTPYRIRAGSMVREGRLVAPGMLIEPGLQLAGVSEVQLDYGERTEWVFASPSDRSGAMTARPASRIAGDLAGGGRGSLARWPGEPDLRLAQNDPQPPGDRSAATADMGPSLLGAPPASGPARQMGPAAVVAMPAQDITRWDIFVPSSAADVMREALIDVDPLAVPAVQPSWRLDGDAWLDDTDPGHFLARKMSQIPSESDPPPLPTRKNPHPRPDPMRAFFNTRRYFCHPLDVRFYGYPSEASPPPPPPPPPLPGAPPRADSIPDDLARTAAVPVAPTAPQSAARAGRAGGTPWYNQAPSDLVPLMGRLNPAPTSDPTFQKLLTTVNKRLVKAWMGELKRHLGSSGDKAELARWFGSDDGRAHFSKWCQALGTQAGNRDNPASAHGHGKALDINYDQNPWVPLCSGDGTTIKGEHFSATSLPPFVANFGDPDDAFRACGRIYDRALRLFVPLVTTEKDPYGTRAFSSTYYRIHYDWTPTRDARDAPPYTAEQVYGFYQILSWSLRFYFDYVYQRCSVFRDDTNEYGDHLPLPAPLNVWRRIEQDWQRGHLAPSAELHVTDPSFIPAAARGLFDDIQMSYSFQRGAVRVSRLRLAERMSAITTDAQKSALGEAISKQLVLDHTMLSHGMVTRAPSRRDPCNGVFSHCFEVVLAFCYLLKDPDVKRLRAFGAFTNGEGGDLQHFDYGFSQR